MEPRFKLNDRVVTPTGEVGTVIGTFIEAEGISASIEQKRQVTYREHELVLAAPQTANEAADLRLQVKHLNDKYSAVDKQRDVLETRLSQAERLNAELQRKLSRPKKPAKKRR